MMLEEKRKIWILKRDEYDTGDYNEIIAVYDSHDMAHREMHEEYGKDGYMIEEHDVLTEGSVTLTRQQLADADPIGGIIISIGADIRHYENVLNVTTDTEVFGASLQRHMLLPRGSGILSIEDVIKLKALLETVIAYYHQRPISSGS